MKRRLAVCAALALAGALQAQPRQPVLQSFDVAAPFAPVLADLGGRQQLVYELYLTNFSSRPIRIDRIEVLGDRDLVLAGAEGDRLAGWMERIGARDAADARLVPPGARVDSKPVDGEAAGNPHRAGGRIREAAMAARHFGGIDRHPRTPAQRRAQAGQGAAIDPERRREQDVGRRIPFRITKADPVPDRGRRGGR